MAAMLLLIAGLAGCVADIQVEDCDPSWQVCETQTVNQNGDDSGN